MFKQTFSALDCWLGQQNGHLACKAPAPSIFTVLL